MKKIALTGLIIIIWVAVILWQGIYAPKDKDPKIEKIFTIKQGQSMQEIAGSLEKENLIKNDFYFIIYLLSKGDSTKLQAGKFLLNSGMVIPVIAQEIISGNCVPEIITIIEGWSINNITEQFKEKGLIENDGDLQEIIFNPIFIKDFSFLQDKPKESDLEGYLFPDTYYFNSGDNAEIVIRKMLENFDKKLTDELREEIGEQKKTIFEIIIMASMIEKEVRSYEDKQLVSGVLWNRLDNHYPLQSCATIAYITGKKTTKISTTETEIDSPYNTYKYKGLPIGPICNPGIESIKAAIYPKKSSYWFYLSAFDGETIFSKTLKEHNIAKAKYLR